MNNENSEKEVRSFLNTLTDVELGDSSYLFGIDFNKESMENIMASIYALFNEVESLKNLVDRDFQQKEGEHVLLPKTPEIKQLVIQNLSRKSSVLQKLMSNKHILLEFNNYLKNRFTAQGRKP